MAVAAWYCIERYLIRTGRLARAATEKRLAIDSIHNRTVIGAPKEA